MTNKEKLDLLWKYLLLAVLLFGFIQIGSHKKAIRFHQSDPCGPAGGHSKMLWLDDGSCKDMDMDIDVEVLKLGDGDSTITVTVNGESINMEGLDLEDLEDGDHKVFMKKMKTGGHGTERRIKVIKKIEEKTE